MKVNEILAEGVTPYSNDEMNDPAWYIVNVNDDVIAGGPFDSKAEAKSKSKTYAWYNKNPSGYDFVHGIVDPDRSDKHDVVKEV